jgi:ATP-dependent DNA helicase DinG
VKTKQDLVTETFEEGGLLSKQISNYKVRPQQVELSKKIQSCIEKEIPLLAEAPTGVGKSLAALVPAFEHIKRTDEPVIVVTSSIILQEQYINKDIPMLEELYGFQVKPVLIKGRNNYLCPKKLNEAKSGNVSFSTSEQIKEHNQVMEWAVNTVTGDKSELDFVPKFGIWANLACVDNQECTGKQCSFYSVCHYYRERSKINTSRLIVCNYHYFFSALESQGNMLPIKAKVVIMDEGHEINAIARDYQERKYSINSFKNHFDRFIKAMKYAELTDIGETVMGLFEEMELNQLNGTLTDLFVGVGHEFKLRDKSKGLTRDFWMIEIPERTRMQKYITAHLDSLKHAAGAADRYLQKFGFSMETIPYTVDVYGEEATEWFVVVHRLMELFEQKYGFLEYVFAFDENRKDGNDIFWLQPYQESVSIHLKPITGARLTYPLFQRKEDGYIPIVMSATLAANQSFVHVKEDLGIHEQMAIEELIVSSPFPLEENILWYLPNDTPAGNDPSHLNFILGEMLKVIEMLEGRTLCLFTSRKNLKEAEIFFNGVLPKHIQVLSQEQLPKQKIIDCMKENPHTVIVGTKSFFTGVDIQGPNLSAVLIDKFPFPMIGDPINDYLMSQPRGFHKFSLPEAIISMRQAFGRLNRTATDKGIVVLYDGRISTARYKNKIFNSFDFKVRATKNWDDVVDYFKDLTIK